MLVATTRDNVSPSLVLELLRRVGGIIKVGCMFVYHLVTHQSEEAVYLEEAVYWLGKGHSSLQLFYLVCAGLLWAVE